MNLTNQYKNQKNDPYGYIEKFPNCKEFNMKIKNIDIQNLKKKFFFLNNTKELGESKNNKKSNFELIILTESF